jgi:hypothetical protein
MDNHAKSRCPARTTRPSGANNTEATKEPEADRVFVLVQNISGIKFYWTSGELFITGRQNALEIPTYREARKQLKHAKELYGKELLACVEYADPSGVSMWKRGLLWVSQQ